MTEEKAQEILNQLKQKLEQSFKFDLHLDGKAGQKQSSNKENMEIYIN